MNNTVTENIEVEGVDTTPGPSNLFPMPGPSTQSTPLNTSTTDIDATLLSAEARRNPTKYEKLKIKHKLKKEDGQKIRKDK
mgnify:CR=1 FL=1